jgi:hypothetical protein
MATALPVQRSSHSLVVGASSLGTLFEWYDFFVYGALATYIAAHFFSAVNPTTGFIFTLAGFAVGFVVRPLGALIFGRVGDMFGRKVTFLITLTMMGLATVFIGLIPGYAAIGIAAPISLVTLRILQGLAVGGEYAGGITYVAEHAPDGRCGFHISFLVSGAMSGLLLSLMVSAAVRVLMGAEAFADWGWRVPFILSAPLLAISLWIRLKLHESPVFEQLKADGATSKAPLAESFLRWANLKRVLIATAAVAGQGVIFYTSSFYALFFLQKAAKLDTLAASLMVGVALAFSALIALLVGQFSDRVGRKPLMLLSFAAAALLYFPLFGALLSAANPELAHAQTEVPITVRADRASCALQFDPTGSNNFERTSCDIALSFLAGTGMSYSVLAADVPGSAQIRIGALVIAAPDPGAIPAGELKPAIAAFHTGAKAILAEAGYRDVAKTSKIDYLRTTAILAVLLAFAALASVSVHTMLPELFPAHIRYSSLALPQNIGAGWFGGLLPATAFAIVAATGNIYAGLWYPVIVAAASFVICLLFLPETRGREL